MKRWVSTLAAVLVWSAAVRADVTMVQSMTIEGGMAQMAAAAGGNMSPSVTTRLKGTKMRTEVAAGPVNIVTILDTAARQVIVLQEAQKTATIASAQSPALPPGTPPAAGPSIDSAVKPTGKSQVIDGVKCDEYAFNTTMDMSAMSMGTQMPPEAAAMMKGIKIVMAGSMWVAKDVPGAAEYIAFQKAMESGDMASAASSMTGVNVPGMDKMMKAMAGLNGLTYMTEMTMTMEGEGQVADMMRQMGPMKMTSKVSSINTEALSDDLFKVPEGYTIVKQ
jgi:hypothetical protein